jgi:hypothetical protein
MIKKWMKRKKKKKQWMNWKKWDEWKINWNLGQDNINWKIGDLIQLWIGLINQIKSLIVELIYLRI